MGLVGQNPEVQDASRSDRENVASSVGSAHLKESTVLPLNCNLTIRTYISFDQSYFQDLNAVQ